MKLNIANPRNGNQKIINLENENDLRIFYEKKINNTIDVSALGSEWKGYILKITGGQDKQGFPMVEGVLTNRRVKLLLPKGMTGCRGFGMKNGEKKKKSVRGCFVSPEISLLNLKIVKEGNKINGLTDIDKKKKLNPKRASKIRKFWSLSKNEDLKKFSANISKNDPADKTKKPKIQRLITPMFLQRKRFQLSIKKKQMIKAKNELRDFGKIHCINKLL
jgi:small subunit ribosomal protein S6e